jgi:hypothetical protein
MPKRLTASDRSSLIRLASGLPKGSEERKAILAGLKKVGMEHASPEALKKYLKEHPKADKKNHTVKKDQGGEKSKGTTLMDAPKGFEKTQKKLEALSATVSKDGWSEDRVGELDDIVSEVSAKRLETHSALEKAEEAVRRSPRSDEAKQGLEKAKKEDSDTLAYIKSLSKFQREVESSAG